MEQKETIFTTISRLAQEHGALNLGQGFPNFEPDPRMVQIVKSLASEKVHQYAPMGGNPMLIQKIVQLTKKFYNRDIEADQILVTAGATQAIFTTITALINAGDEVIMFDPAYDCYETPILLRKAHPVRLNLTFPEYQINWEEVRNKVNSKTKMIIINNPHNPSGATLKEEDLDQLEVLLEEYPQLLVLADEVYEYISYKKHFSVHHRRLLRERSIIVSSFGKTLHITGWKIGYLISDEKWLKEIASVHQYNVFAVNSLCQVAIARFIDLEEVANLSQFFADKRALFLNSITNSRFKIIPSGGTYFQLLDYSNISQEADNDMAMRLIKEYGIATIPVSGFYKDQSDHKVLRFCYGKDDESLIQAGRILCQI